MLLDGKYVASIVEEEIKDKIKKIIEEGKRLPKLVVVMVGNNEASKSYVRSKEKKCTSLGILSKTLHFETITENELLLLIDKLNQDDTVDGILVQLPLPEGIDTKKILERIRIDKDVDGFSATNLGKLVLGEKGVVSCTPKGIMTILDKYDIEISGKEVVIIGRSNIVGKPLINLFLNQNATVTVTHSKTKNLKEVTKRADILVVAIGKAKFVDASFVKEGAVVIDVGINRVDGKIVGDVDFESLKDVAASITPVPGGVGPMTIISLMDNLIELYDLHQ